MAIKAGQQILGTYGKVWWDGVEVFEVESFQASIKAEREDVLMPDTLSVDSRIKALKGEGKLKIKKVFSRGLSKLLNAWKNGEDPRSQLIGRLKDPQTKNKQSERVVIDNVWFNELTLMDFELGKKLETEFPFGFTPDDVSFPDLIEE